MTTQEDEQTVEQQTGGFITIPEAATREGLTKRAREIFEQAVAHQELGHSEARSLAKNAEMLAAIVPPLLAIAAECERGRDTITTLRAQLAAERERANPSTASNSCDDAAMAKVRKVATERYASGVLAGELIRDDYHVGDGIYMPDLRAVVATVDTLRAQLASAEAEHERDQDQAARAIVEAQAAERRALDELATARKQLGAVRGELDATRELVALPLRAVLALPADMSTATSPQIAKSLGLRGRFPVHAASGALQRAVRMGYAHRERWGQYALTDKGVEFQAVITAHGTALAPTADKETT